MIEVEVSQQLEGSHHVLPVILLAALLLAACASPTPREGAADDRVVLDPGSWPCHRSLQPTADCRLRAAEGFALDPDAELLTFHDRAAEAELAVSVLEGPAGVGAIELVQEVMEVWQLKLAPAVSWDQDPQGPIGYEVRGISGTERLILGADPHLEPRRFHVVSYRNPLTGRILLLEASAAPSVWQQVWPRLATVFAEVRLTEDF